MIHLLIRLLVIACKASKLCFLWLLIRWFGAEGAACILACFSALQSRLAFACRSLL
jgi:hypothetical protein